MLFRSDERQFADLVNGVRRIEASLGNGQKGIADCEVWEATYSRRSIIVMRDVAKGSPITAEDLAILRPGTGLHPREWKNVIGRPAARDLKAREPLTADMLAP